MVNTNTYEILSTMAKLHKSGDEFKHITFTELNAHLSSPTDENCIANLQESNYFTNTSKIHNGIHEQAYILLPTGYDYINKYKSDMKNNLYIKATFWIALITLIATILITLI